MKSAAVEEKYLNFIFEIEKKLTNFLKKLKVLEAILEIDYKNLKPRCSSFGVLYGLRKTFINNYNSRLQINKIFSSIIESITKISFTAKNNFEFSKELCERNSEYFTVFFDAEFLFTSIPLKGIIKIHCDSLWHNQELLPNTNKNQFEKLLRAALLQFFKSCTLSAS